MPVASAKRPRCIVVAGPNGSGKTTFARDFLPDDAGVVHFINADLIASGLSPLDPKLAAVAAGRLVLTEMKRLAALRVDFAWRYAASQPAFGKVDTTFHERTLNDVSSEDGTTSNMPIVRRLTLGRCTTTLAVHPD